MPVYFEAAAVITALVLTSLHAAGVKIVMPTGDNRTTAGAVARELGLDAVEAEVMPERKGEIVKRLGPRGACGEVAGG